MVVTQASHCWRVGDPLLDRHLSEAMGTAVRVTPEADVPHQDMGQVSIISTATLRWCRDRWGGSADPRRLRVNVVVTSDEPFVEEGWVGRELEIGSARVLVTERVPRCRMIDIDQDGAVPGVKWLRPLGRERDMSLAVYADDQGGDHHRGPTARHVSPSAASANTPEYAVVTEVQTDDWTRVRCRHL